MPPRLRGRCIDHHAGAQCRWCTFDGYNTWLTGPREAGHVDGPEEFIWLLSITGVLRCWPLNFGMSALYSLRGLYEYLSGISPYWGHGYGSIYPGPIGAVISPLLAAIKILKIYPTPALYAPLVKRVSGAYSAVKTDFASSSGDAEKGITAKAEQRAIKMFAYAIVIQDCGKSG